MNLHTLRKEWKRIASVALVASTALLLNMSSQVSTAGAAGPVTLVNIATAFNGIVGIDYHEPTNSMLVSVNYPSGAGHNFELVAADGTHTTFAPSVAGLTDEVYISTVRTSTCQGGFTVGTSFTGTGAAGNIAKISPDGLTVTNPWVSLPGETGLLRGGLFQDRYCAFGGDLIVATTTGNVWRVTSAGVATHLGASAPTIPGGPSVEGPVTVPNNAAKYGPWAGKVLVAAEGAGLVWAIDSAGVATSYNLGTPQAENLNIVGANENFFGVNFSAGTLVGASASQFSSMVGDVVLAGEDGQLYDITWNGSAFTASALLSPKIAQFEGAVFAPAGVVNLLPVFLGNEGADIAITGSTNLTGTVTALWTYSPGAGVDAGATCSFGNAALAATTIKCTDDGSYNLTLTFSNGTATVTSTTTVQVSNVAPVITSLAAPATGLLANLTAPFTDAGANDTHTCSIAWGDATTSAGVVAETPGTGTCSGSHTYAAAGTFTISVTVTDDDTASDTKTITVTVVAPKTCKDDDKGKGDDKDGKDKDGKGKDKAVGMYSILAGDSSNDDCKKDDCKDGKGSAIGMFTVLTDSKGCKKDDGKGDKH